MSPSIPPRTVHRIRELRYEDGLSCPQVAVLVGVGTKTVGRYAPGQPGKVPNAPVREVFLASGLAASAVAKELGWYSGRSVDASRVRRSLGLSPDRSGAKPGSYVRRNIDAETAMNIAEACGVPAWSVLPVEDEQVAA